MQKIMQYFIPLIIALLFISNAKGEFAEGVHYEKLEPPLKEVNDSSKLEIVELFWYGCPHCFEFEPYLKRWVNQNDKKVNLTQVPAVFSKNWIPHAKAFYSAQNVGYFDTLHENLFKAIHVDRKKVYTKSKLIKFASDIGIPRNEFEKSFSSFKTDLQVKKAMAITKSSGIRGVPAIIVGGEYASSPRMAGSYKKLIEVIDYLAKKNIKK
tara:strand:+ start:373 stop:1002 length:630 start_codon:yes stop_codon:yes gene_type:complete